MQAKSRFGCGVFHAFLLASCICAVSASVTVQYVTSSTGYPTAGAVTVTVYGSGFGSASAGLSVQIGSTACSQPAIALTNARITCKLGAYASGSATGLIVSVTAGASSGATGSFNYNPPSVFFVSNERPTTGGLVTVTGSNFGLNAAPTSLLIGSTECSSPTKLLAHSAVTCTLMPLSALPSFNLIVRIIISNQTGATSGFSYHVPSLVSISTDRPTSGGIRVTFSGSNFGALVSPSSVTIGAAACTSPTIIAPHVTFSCILPPNDFPADDLSVSAVFDTRQANATHLKFSYDSPTIVSFSSPRPLEGGTITVFGSNFGAASSPSSVKIGLSACDMLAKVTSHTAFKCRLQRIFLSAGSPSSQGLVFNATFGSRIATQTFNYDTPSITGLSASRPAAGGSITIFGSDFGTSANSWTVAIGSSSCASVNFLSSSSMQCLSKALSVGLGTSLPMHISIVNLTSVSSSFSYSAPVLVSYNATSTGGVPTEGGGWIRVDGNNLMPMDTTNAPVKVGSSACSSSDWLSFTSFRCTLRAYSAGSAVALPVLATVGGQVGSASTMFSYNPPEFSSMSGPPYTPGSRVTIIGRNFGASSLPTSVRIGLTSCSSTVMVLPHLAFSCLLPVPNTNDASHALSVNIGGKEVIYNNNQIIYSKPNVQRSRGHSQTVASGSSFVTLIGNLFGEINSSPTARLGSSMSSVSIWTSSSSVKSKVVSGFGCSLPGTVSFYRGASSGISMAFSYLPQIVAAASGLPFVTTGASSITVVGSGLGVRRAPGSVSTKMGSSSCLSSHWASNSHIACKLHPGSGHIYQIVSTAPGDSTCTIVTRTLLYPHTTSYDSPSVLAAKDVNTTFTSTGSAQMLLYGAAFSTSDSCIRLRLGFSAAVMTRWISQSALLCKKPVSSSSVFLHVTASTPSQVPPVAVGSHSISGFVRSVLSGQPVPDARVSILCDGIVVASARVDSIGYFVFDKLINSDYIVATQAPGFAPLVATVSSSQTSQNYTAAVGPALEIRQSRIVLTWASSSIDLDAHLQSPDGCKVYSDNMRCSNTWLSPHVVGGSGPESISLTSPVPGTYSYSISARCQGDIIRSAHWETLDVTQAVRNMVEFRCANGFSTLEFDGDYNALFGDPAFGVVKVMKIVFSDGSEWSGVEYGVVAVPLPQVELSQSRFVATFYGMAPEPFVFVAADIFLGNTLLVFNFSVGNDGKILITHVSSSIRAFQDMAEISSRQTPSAARNLQSRPFLIADTFSEISIHGHNSSTIPTSGAALLTAFGLHFGTLAATNSIRLSMSATEFSAWLSDSLVSCKVVASSRFLSSVHVTVNHLVGSKQVVIGTHNITASSLTHSSDFAFDKHETPSVLSGRSFGTILPSREGRILSVYIDNAVCSTSRWLSDSSIICESSPVVFQKSSANITIVAGLVSEFTVPIHVQFENVPAICDNERMLSSASYELAPVILKACRGRTVVIDRRSSIVPVFPAPQQVSSRFRDENLVRFVRLQGRSVYGALQISHVSVISADGVRLSLHKEVSSSGSKNASALNSVVDGPAEARVQPGIWEGLSNQDWLEIDLGQEHAVAQIVFYNRLDCCQSRAENALVTLMDSSRVVVDFATLSSDLVQPINFSSSCSESDINSLSCSCGTGFSDIGLRSIDVDRCSRHPGVHIFNSTRSCSVGGKSASEFTCSCIGHPSNFNSYRIACSCSVDGMFSCMCAGSSSWTDPEFNTCNVPSIYQQLPGLDLCSSSSHNCSTSGGLCQMTGLHSFNCSCLNGYRGNGNVCEDIDECSENTHNCSQGSICVNNPGSFSCAVDFCAIGNNCSAMATCSNTALSYFCTCNPGFNGNGHVCTDIDECALNIHNCWAPEASLLKTQDPLESCKHAAVGNINCMSIVSSRSAVCNNSIGSYSCQCPAGFSGDGRSCFDIDECKLGVSPCSSPHSNAFCINTFGSYECQCKPGYSGPLSLKTCPEGAIRLYTQQECAALTGNWHSNGECLKPGGGSFSFDNRPQCFACSDINECTPGSTVCPANSICSNSAGSYRCACNQGFAGDGKTCWDIDECATNTHNCSASHKCVNVIGSFRCQCIGADCFGYSGDCELNPSMCGSNGVCNTTMFGTACSCRNGYDQVQGYSGAQCAGVYDPLCWTHSATSVVTASNTANVLSASLLSMSSDSRYVLAAQSPGLVFLSVLPLSQSRLLSESPDHAVSLYINGVFTAMSKSGATFTTFLNPNTPNILAIETSPLNSFAVILDNLPSRASQWKCTISSSMSSQWKHADFDDSDWAPASATSFIAADTSNPSLNGAHRSSQWISFASTPVLVSGSVSNPIFASTGAVFDDFQSNVLITNHWTYLHNSNLYFANPMPSSYSVGAGYLNLLRQPIIRSTFQFNSSLMFPITVSGSFTLNHLDDYFVLCTRSDGTRPQDNSPSGSANGLCFFFGTGENLQQTIGITMRISGNAFNAPAVTKTSASWRADVDITFYYRIVDGGSFAEIYIDDRLELSRYDLTQSFMPGSYIIFFNSDNSNSANHSLKLGPISISMNAALSGPRLFCRASTPVFRGGRTFNRITSLPSAAWVDAALSASGRFQIIAAKEQLLRMSTDAGRTWNSVIFPETLSSDKDWSCVAISGDGNVVVAATRLKFIFVSRNGVWVQSRIVASWKSVAASYDGTRIVAAADNNGGIFFTTDFGNSWNQNTGIRYFGKDWTSVSISNEGSSIVVASNWVGQVKELIQSFSYQFLVLNSTCNFFSSWTENSYTLSPIKETDKNYVAQFHLRNYNPDPSSGIDTFVIAFTCSKSSRSLLHGIVTSLADSPAERRLFCSSDVSGEAWKSPDFDDSTWQLPSVVNLSSADTLNPNATKHMASPWIVDQPSLISSSSQILWAPDASASSFSCRYKLPASELGFQDWNDDTRSRPPASFMSRLWQNATVSERGTSWTAPTPLGYTTFSNSLLACQGANVGSDLLSAQIACEKCIDCHSILRVGTDPGVFSLRPDTSARSFFEQQTTNEFSVFQPGPVPTAYPHLTVTEANYQSSVWFLGRQVGVAESHDFGRTWSARSSQRKWSNALISADGTTVFACLNGKIMKTRSFDHIQVSLSFTSIPPPNSSDISYFSIFGSVLRGVGVVSKHSATVGPSSHIFVPQASLNSFTVMLWIQTSSACSAADWSNGCAILHASASNKSFSLHIASGKLIFSVGPPHATVDSSEIVSDSKWHFIAASWNASTGAMKLYVDGELTRAGDSLLRDHGSASHTHTIKLGGHSNFNGSYDDVRVFSVAFESVTIQNVFNRSMQLSIPYGASTKMSFSELDDDLWAPAAGSCVDQKMNSAAISSDGSHIIAVLQPASTVQSVYDFNAHRRLESYECVDIDECALGTHNCSSEQSCFNIQGSFVCNCSTGFSRLGGQCVDINECATGTPCGSSGICINTIGSFSCSCKPGYGNVGCADINECGATVFPCPFKSLCTNTPGSFTCACPPGTALNGSACDDIDECQTGAHNCMSNICVNKFGSFDCVCSNCSSLVQGTITSVFTGLKVLSAEIFILSHGSTDMIAMALMSPFDNGTFTVNIPMSASVDIQYRLVVKSFHNADVYMPFTVAANQPITRVNVSVFQYCDSLLADAARVEYSGCINSDPNMFIAVPDRVPISKHIKLFGADFPLLTCEARLGINITADPSSYFIAHSCLATSSMTALVLANNNTESFVPLQLQLLFRISPNSSVTKILTSDFGIVTLLNGSAVIHAVSPASVYAGSTVTVVGKNFPYPLLCTAKVGLSAATAAATDSCTILSSKFIAVGLSNAAIGSLNVYVFMNDADVFFEASPRPLNVRPAPSLSSIFPNFGYVGSHITISGSNFDASSSCTASVKLVSSGSSSLNSAATCVLISSTKITLIIGTAASLGESSVTLKIASYSPLLNISSLTVVALPSVESFSPLTAYSGCKITITGSSFIQQDYSCVVFVGNPLASAVASSVCSIISSTTIIFAVGNGSKVQANAFFQVAFNVAVRASSPTNSFLNIVAPPGPGTVPQLEIWYNADISNTMNFNSAPVNGGDISQWTDRSAQSHNANNAGNSNIKPKWISNVLNGYGVIRFNKALDQYLDINPVAYLNDKSTYSVFIIARLTQFVSSGVQYLVSDSSNGLRIFFNGSRWCVQATLASGVGCSDVAGDTQFHVFSLLFDGSAVGDRNRTRFRYDFRDQLLSFAAGTSQASTTGSFARWQIGGETVNNSQNHLNGDVAEIVVFSRTLSQCDVVGVESYLRDHWALPLEVLS